MFRAPTSAGFLSDILRMHANKAELLRVIEGLEYVPMEASDIRFALSPSALLLVGDLVRERNRNVTATIDSLCSTVRDRQTADFQTLLARRGGGGRQLMELKAPLEPGLFLLFSSIVSPHNTSASFKSTLTQIATRMRKLVPDHLSSLQLLEKKPNSLDFVEVANGSPHRT